MAVHPARRQAVRAARIRAASRGVEKERSMGTIRVEGFSPEIQPGTVTVVTVEDREAAEAAAAAALAAQSGAEAAQSGAQTAQGTAAAAAASAVVAKTAAEVAQAAVDAVLASNDGIVAALVGDPSSATRAGVRQIASPIAAADRPVEVTLNAQWDARLRSYNLNTTTLARARAALARALNGGSPMKLHVLGHSYLTGFQTAAPYPSNTSAAIMTRMLDDSKVLGKVAEGYRPLTYGTTPGARLSDDPRFVVAPEWTYMSGYGYAAASAYRNIVNTGDISFTPDFPVTNLEVVYLDGPATQPFSFSVDGGAFTSSSVTGGASTAVWKSRVTAVTLGSHTITVRPPATGQAMVMAFRAWDSTHPNAIEVTNGGVSGSIAGGASVGSWTAAMPAGYIGALPTVDFFKPELALIMLGTNDRNAGITEAAFLTAMTTLVNRVKTNGGSVILLREPMPTDDTYTRGLYGLADTLGVGLIETGLDWPTPYSASKAEPYAYIGTDGSHPSPRGHTAIARVIAQALINTL
ncbi:SGNH/GDSL hydrolase family protein [Agromyces badenianii]|uniref:SGNH/GDSL hydrolase family protein n=1 Tax=Agromyces badenianii TaxID=2080742 RepID=UPI0010595CE1|nr:SGNH/GDSL hydrolase family protein [Agromyces badenianii]